MKSRAPVLFAGLVVLSAATASEHWNPILLKDDAATDVRQTPLASSSTSKKILGRWKDEDHGAVVEVKEANGVFTGRIVSTPLKGVKVGLPVFRGLRWDTEKRRWKGKVYAPRRKSEYNASWRIEDGRLLMKVTFGPLWKTVAWDRVKN